MNLNLAMFPENGFGDSDSGFWQVWRLPLIEKTWPQTIEKALDLTDLNKLGIILMKDYMVVFPSYKLRGT